MSATWRRQREDDMEVADRQQVGLALEPARCARRRPGTWGNAGCGRSCRQCADARSPRRLDVAAKRGRAAILDCRHDAPLDTTEMRGMGATERLAVAAEDVRYL